MARSPSKARGKSPSKDASTTTKTTTAAAAAAAAASPNTRPNLGIASPASSGAASSTESTQTMTISLVTTRSTAQAVRPLASAEPARTPSYPFPSMSTPLPIDQRVHTPFTALSPTVAPPSRSIAAATTATTGTPGSWPDAAIASVGGASPAPAMNPGPPSSCPTDPRAAADFPLPSLYETVLALHAEPGLDQWWARVVRLLREHYRADRLSLAVPADPTDLQNVPWGQKATFNMAAEDPHSIAYLVPGARRSSSDASEREASEAIEVETSGGPGDHSSSSSHRPRPVRPPLANRHSFAGFEGARPLASGESPPSPRRRRPPAPGRTQSHWPPMQGTLEVDERPQHRASLSSSTLREHAARSNPHLHHPHGSARRARVVPVVQGLDYEPDPLIDAAGVHRVLDRGKVIVLSREYHRTASSSSSSSRTEESSVAASSVERGQERERAASESSTSAVAPDRRSMRPPAPPRTASRISPVQGRSGVDMSQIRRSLPRAPNYEEFEQMPSSAWSQSPAPSPAIRPDPVDNPFFADPTVDEESFNPSAGGHSEDYTAGQRIEAIGVDQASTIVHVPLIHPLLSQPISTPYVPMPTPLEALDGTNDLDLAGGATLEVPMPAPHRTAIAIVSFASTVVPYPAHLIHSLTHLGPHLATSYSLAQHFTDVQSQAASLLRRHHHPSSLMPPADVVTDTHGLEDLAGLPMSPSSSSPHSMAPSINGTLASPSEPAIGSPGESIVGTPGWDPSNLGFSASNDRRVSGGAPGPSPGADLVDSYFSTRRRQFQGRPDGHVAASGSENTRSGPPNAERMPSSQKTQPQSQAPAGLLSPQPEHITWGSTSSRSDVSPPLIGEEGRRMPGSGVSQDQAKPTHGMLEGTENTSAHPPRTTATSGARGRRVGGGGGSGGGGGHTLLHSYGADFGSTFQSLPTASGSMASRIHRGGRHHGRSASDSAPAIYEMPPPSERLLRTMIDAIPVQIFTAAPQDGRITWVNSKFLAYRGHTVQDFVRDPWQSIDPEQRDEYLRAWSHSLRNGEQFSYRVRLRRFDGSYRWFYVRAAPLRDTKGITVHWFGTNMDIHDQHMAELSAARQRETAASESKYRALANSSPQIVFAATDSRGVTFANTQWMHYSGQRGQEALGLGFTEHVHPDDLVKCKLPGFTLDPDPPPLPPPTPAPAPAAPPKSSRASSGLGSMLSASDSSHTSSTATQETVVAASPPREDDLHIGAGVRTDAEPVKAIVDSDGRPSYSVEVRLQSKDGEYRWHLVRCTRVEASFLGTDEHSWLGTCTDINDHKVLEQKMTETMESKTRFLSNMSHEIRTPLIGISGMVQFLYETSMTPEQIDYCDTIMSSSKGLLNIVNDILDLSKIEAGMMSLTYNWFYIRATIESVNDALSSQAINKGLELNYIVDDDVPPRLWGDEARIRQVLMNLLGNAVKFTAKGEVFAHCSVLRNHDEPLSDEEIVLMFEVKDSGPGFTAEEAQRIFKPFSQIDASTTRQYGGSGLGLVISRQLVELHGGEMTGSSVPGKGSTFRFVARFKVPPTADDEEPVAPVEELVDEPIMTARLPLSPYLSRGFTQSPSIVSGSGGGESQQQSPALLSSASSDPSVRSLRSARTDRSSMSSVTPAFPNIDGKHRDTGSPMKLVLPRDTIHEGESTDETTTKAATMNIGSDVSSRRRLLSDPAAVPRMYSILVVCPQPYALLAITNHIERSLPETVPHQVTSRDSVLESQRMLGGDDPVIFSHIVLNVAGADEAIAVIDQVFGSTPHLQTSLVVVTDAKRRHEIKRQAQARGLSSVDQEWRVQFLHKPIKPSRIGEIFDPHNERQNSTDRIRRTAEQLTDRRRQVFAEMEKNMGHRGHRVLLVEDNPTNQKVIGMFLKKVGMQVEIVTDGVECLDRVFQQEHGYYSLVLCDLQMPNKDGYQTCKEIRQWEREHQFNLMPIIALSANVIGDVLDRCVEAGFNSYLSKPLEFQALSKAMTDLMDRSKPHPLMRLGS
ncbi:MAG: hypothetical protein M1823_003655 [Watsoniomyces obsoletus]|nr:MAG: hypothetical protein M1823_003655 [Watsoniomyces obsoletus]